MRKYFDKKERGNLVILAACLLCILLPFDAKASDISQKGEWKSVEDNWFFYDGDSIKLTGWQQIEGKWYFLSNGLNNLKGKMLTGWQWIDGRCYYLAENSVEKYLKGAMYLSDATPDGYRVSDTGAWIEGNQIIEVPGKGIQTAIKKDTSMNTTTLVSGSRGGGGGGGKKNESTNVAPNKNVDINPVVKPDSGTPINPEPEHNKDENESSAISDKQYVYTIKYLDIADKATLHVVTGKGKGGDIIQLKPVNIDGYHICKGQKDSFTLTSNNFSVLIFYQKEFTASPSEAKKVEWHLKFIEEGNLEKEVLKEQKGQSEEGKELVVDFPETIIGTDKFYYHSVVSSPWNVVVNGNGIQKYYIEYRKGERIPEDSDSDADSKVRLNMWLEIAKEADYSITGEYPTDMQVISGSQSEGNERLFNLVSMIDGTDRKEIYLIARGYYPNAGIISQRFQSVKNISELQMEEVKIAGNTYTILRVGVEKTYLEGLCSHDYKVIDEVVATCMENGHVTTRCNKCGKEESIVTLALGHVDLDHDGICDVCQEPSDKAPEAVHYGIGDVQVRTIGNRTYLFRCIDDDYEDAMGNSQKLALFLCDSVIRSDIGGASKKLNFGDNNNYKYSKVREWLLENAKADFVHETYIGITNSYMGATTSGAYEQFSESSLLGQSRLFQQLEDRVFILSVDEAIKYKDYLWKFNGSEENNSESQISAYSKGYYLRTPQNGGLEDFWYGEGIYAVSLLEGNIRPVEVSETSIGIRPVMAIPQGE
jgi:hypothetical protein